MDIFQINWPMNTRTIKSPTNCAPLQSQNYLTNLASEIVIWYLLSISTIRIAVTNNVICWYRKLVLSISLIPIVNISILAFMYNWYRQLELSITIIYVHCWHRQLSTIWLSISTMRLLISTIRIVDIDTVAECLVRRLRDLLVAGSNLGSDTFLTRENLK